MCLAPDRLVSGRSIAPCAKQPGRLCVMTAKGMDTGDRVLASAVALRMVNALMKQVKMGKIVSPGKKGGVRVWALP